MKKTTKKSVWRQLVEQELKQGDAFKVAVRDAKKRYDVYKKTGKIPPIK